MKSFILSILLVAAFQYAAAQKEYALLVIDVQNFYFPGGRSELVEPEKAAEKAAIAIRAARETGNPVIYIQHKSASGMEINDIVKPVADVHASTLATLKSYSAVLSVTEWKSGHISPACENRRPDVPGQC